MPEQPTYDQIQQFADKLTDKANGMYGICLRGKAGLGRKHGVRNHAREHLRWPLVRREVGAATDLAGMEKGD